MRWDTVILGAGAAGLMCAAHMGGRTLIVDHAKAPGEKIRISGGGGEPCMIGGGVSEFR